MHRLSISTRLALWYGLSLTLLLGLVVAFLYAGFHLTLHRDFDADLEREAGRLASAFESAQQAATPDAAAVPDEFALAAAASPYAVRLFSASGAERYANGRLLGAFFHPPTETDAYHTHGSDALRTRYASLRDGSGAAAGWVAVAERESDLHREMHRLGWLLALGVLMGVAVAGVSGYGLARRALRPVAALTRAAGSIGPADRGARLPTGGAPNDELGDLAAAFNGLLARLDEAFVREQRFRADAAHELLTPVTAARSEIDVALHRDRDAQSYRTTLRTVRDHVDRLTSLVTGLLALSRAEAEGQPLAGAVDLTAVARESAQRLEAVAQAKGVTLVRALDGEVRAAASLDHVATALGNLLDNAIKYTPTGGNVELSVRRQGGEAVARIADTGVGFTADERDRLFGRFYRADVPAVRREQGSGLGLAIAQRLAGHSGGRVTAASAGLNQGSVFELRLPSAG